MSKFIIEEFKHYKVSIYSGNDPEHAEFGIQLDIPSGHVIYKFTDQKGYGNRIEELKSRKEYIIYEPVSKYPMYIDILRHEMPLYFYFNLLDYSSYITTSDEPVGEGDHDVSD